MSKVLKNGTHQEMNHAEPTSDDKESGHTLNGVSSGKVAPTDPEVNLTTGQDYLFHLGLGSGSHDLVDMFGDVKFVCMGGKQERMEQFAYYIMNEIGHQLPTGAKLADISKCANRYSMYKAGPVLCVSHGIGTPSICVLLHELIKLLHHARVRDPVFFRIGTCGGVGVDPGTLVLTEEAVDEYLQPHFELPALGKPLKLKAHLDRELVDGLKALHRNSDPYKTVSGKTLCARDFYIGQARLDGAFCPFTKSDQMKYLSELRSAGVVNIEMESLAFAALTQQAGFRSAVVCVTFLDRLKGDQVLAPKEDIEEWEKRPQKLVARYIKLACT